MAAVRRRCAALRRGYPALARVFGLPRRDHRLGGRGIHLLPTTAGPRASRHTGAKSLWRVTASRTPRCSPSRSLRSRLACGLPAPARSGAAGCCRYRRQLGRVGRCRLRPRLRLLPLPPPLLSMRWVTCLTILVHPTVLHHMLSSPLLVNAEGRCPTFTPSFPRCWPPAPSVPSAPGLPPLPGPSPSLLGCNCTSCPTGLLLTIHTVCRPRACLWWMP